MDLKNRTLWQVGAGDTNRSYGDVCTKYDVMLLGPGDRGPFDEQTYADQGDVVRFYRDACLGDAVLLRLGTGQILAVGLIADEQPLYSDAFGDVDGWDLQHVRRVCWVPNSGKEFPSRTLGGQVKPFAGVNVPEVRQWVESIDIPETQIQRPLADLPKESEPLDDENLGRALFLEGLSSVYINNVTARLETIRRVAQWYWNEEKRPTNRPSESETISYLVLPLLFALGWSEQTVAIEWNQVDVALFEKMPTDDQSLACVIEAKSLGSSVFSPLGQARAYASQVGRDNCKRLVVTDGIRYTYFERQDKLFELRAYLNILSMRKDYPIYNCKGAVEAIIGMAR